MKRKHQQLLMASASISLIVVQSNIRYKTTHNYYQCIPSFLSLRPTSSLVFCKIGVDKEEWINKKTKDTFGFAPLVNDIQYKDLEIGTGQKLLSGQVATVKMSYSGSAAGRPFEKWSRLRFILGEEYQNVPPGVQRGVEGMRTGGKRMLVVPPETTNGKFPSAVFLHLDLLHVCEVNSLTEAEMESMGEGRLNAILTRLRLRKLVNSLKSRFFGVHYETEEEWKQRKRVEIIPAETEEEFLGLENCKQEQQTKDDV